MNIGTPKNVSGRRPRARKWMHAGFLVLLLLAIMVGSPLHQTPPAEAQTATTLVKNTGQTAHSQGRSLSSTYPREAQAFTTGTSPTGYTLSSIGVNFQSITNPSSAAAELSATLNENDSGEPGNALCTLVTPTLTGSGVQTFNAPSSDPCPNLQASSTYHVVVTQTAFTKSFKVHSTTGDNEDSGAATGWTIANNSNSYVASSSSWGADSSSRALMIEVKGTAVVTPALVKNTGQTSSGTGTLSSGKRAQAFTTGRSGYGYAISSLGIDFSNIASTSTAGSNIKVTLNSVSGSDPGSVLCTLSDPTSFSSSGVQTFNVPPDTDSNPCPTLTPATTYFVVIERTGTGSDAIVLDLAGTSEDSGGAPGWSIADEQFFRTGLAWNRSTSQAHQIEVKGEIITGPGDVPLNWALTPTGLTTGDKFRLLFITHTGRSRPPPTSQLTTPTSKGRPTPAAPTWPSSHTAPGSV